MSIFVLLISIGMGIRYIHYCLVVPALLIVLFFTKKDSSKVTEKEILEKEEEKEKDEKEGEEKKVLHLSTSYL